MTDTEKLISDLKNHRQAYAEGVMKVEHRDITAMSTVDVLDRAIEYIERGYLKEESEEHCLTPWGCLLAILSDYGIEISGISGRAGTHIVEDFLELMEKIGYVGRWQG